VRGALRTIGAILTPFHGLTPVTISSSEHANDLRARVRGTGGAGRGGAGRGGAGRGGAGRGGARRGGAAGHQESALVETPPKDSGSNASGDM